MSQFKRLVEMILELHSAGWTDAEISTALEVSRGVVHYVVDMCGEAAEAQ